MSHSKRAEYPQRKNEGVQAETLELDEPQVHTLTDASGCRQAAGSLHLSAEVVSNILGHILIREDPICLISKRQRRWRKELKSLGPFNSGPASIQQTHRTCELSESSSKHDPYELLNPLLINRAFYFAGVETLYGGNELAFSNGTHLQGFLDDLSTDRKYYIKRLRVGMLLADAYWEARTPPRRLQPFIATRPAEVYFADVSGHCDPSESTVLLIDIPGALPKLEKVSVDVCIPKSRGLWTPADLEWFASKLEGLIRKAWNRRVECVVSATAE